MNPIRPKRPRTRLVREAYERLRQQVLKRDNWRCQGCGALGNLQVHHKEFRSHLGDDTEDNFVTLCARCHASPHQAGLFTRDQ
jgi:5-methylcytosine-specific restriction endonuclease McrA